MSENQEKKENKWLFLAIGLIVGFLISAVTFVVFAMIQNPSRSLPQTIKYIYNLDKSTDTVVKYVTVVRTEPVSPIMGKQVQQQDSLVVEDASAEYDEVDFSYADNGETVNDDVVFVEKIILQKKIKVQCKDADFNDIAPVEGTIEYFNVQQWNTPIKNKIMYNLSGNVLQVKGLLAEKVQVIYYDKQYYLCYGGNYFLMEKSDNFENLGAPLALNPQK